MQNFVRQWTKKSTGQCVRWFEKSTGQFKKPPAFVRFPVLNTTPVHKASTGCNDTLAPPSTAQTKSRTI